MRYLLMICSSDVADDASLDVASATGCGSWVADMTERGVLRDLVGLQPRTDATTVRVRHDEVLLTDGPFAETKDQIGGFAVVECADLDEAVEVASRHPAARYGTIEVRPVREP